MDYFPVSHTCVDHDGIGNHVVLGTADEMDDLLDNNGVLVNPRLFRDGTVQVGCGGIACSS